MSRASIFVRLVLIFVVVGVASPFLVVRTGSSPSPAVSPLSCICIDCKLVDVCAAYHFVEEKHSQPHIWRPKGEGGAGGDEKPPFEPRDGSPTIEVHIRRVDNRADAEAGSSVYNILADMGFFTSSSSSSSSSGGAGAPADPALPPSLASTFTTVEYDVVKCADFVEERSKWRNNMPEEIRLANPDFVPP